MRQPGPAPPPDGAVLTSDRMTGSGIDPADLVALRESRFRRPLRRRRLGAVTTTATVVLALLAIAAIAAPLLAPFGPNDLVTTPFQGPSWSHLCGTDELGRDILSRLLFGARVSLSTAVGAAALAAAIGVPIGMLAGYFGKWVDAPLMRLMDLILSLPDLLLALVVVTVIGGSNLDVLLAIAIVSVPSFARLARASTLATRERPYVLAARSVGAGRFDVLTRTILPNIRGPLLVQAILTASLAILIAASLNFLGLGAPPPAPSWGAMLQTAYTDIHQSVWYGVFSGAILAITIGALDQVGRAAQARMGGRSSQLKMGGMV